MGVLLLKAEGADGARCRLYVVFHGCRQAREFYDEHGDTVGDLFAREAGYTRWAVGSRIVVLYPQVQPSDTGKRTEQLAVFGSAISPLMNELLKTDLLEFARILQLIVARRECLE